MNYWNIIIGNIWILLAMFTDSFSSGQKTVKRTLWMQNLSQAFYGASSIFANAYSACAQNVVSIIRNLVAIRKISAKWIEWFLTILGVVLGLVFNNRGWIGLLPIIANLQYTIVIFRFRGNEHILKASFLVNALMFSVFNGAVGLFVGVFTNLVVAVSTGISLIRRR